MAKLLLGKEVVSTINNNLKTRANALKADNILPTLAIIRCGDNQSDLAYVKGAETRAELTGGAVQNFVLPNDTDKKTIIKTIDDINADPSIHGCLMLRPLPNHLREVQDEICNRLIPTKDVDCMTDVSNAAVFTGKQAGFPPCTPQACLEILDYYGLSCEGKRTVIIGRSLVVGKPLAMMMLAKNATVTICHTKTVDLPKIAREAEILVTSAGVLNSITKDYVNPGQVVIDVSINWDENKPNAKGGVGAIAGDALFEEVEPIVKYITPVPGGVGTVTTSVLMGHVIKAAERLSKSTKN